MPGISPGRAYAILTTTAAPSHPAKQLFCMTQINSEASMVPAPSEGSFYLFKNVFYDSYLAVVDAKLAAYPSSGYIAGASSNQAAAALIYSNSSFFNQYNGRLVGVVANGQGMVEDDGSGSVTFAANQALQITPVTGVGLILGMMQCCSAMLASHNSMWVWLPAPCQSMSEHHSPSQHPAHAWAAPQQHRYPCTPATP